MLLKLSKFFLYASLFSVVIVMITTFFPFIGGKYYFFRIMVELSIIFFLLSWAFERDFQEVVLRAKRVITSPLFIAVTVFVLMFTLAVVFAHDARSAFWSNYERGDGGFQMLHYYAFFVLLTLLIGKETSWRRVFKVALVAAVILILYGLASSLGLKGFIGPGGGEASGGFWKGLMENRFQGSLGNPAYVAPYLMFSIFYAFYLFFGDGIKNKKLRWIIYGGLIAIFLFFFVLTQTRGTFLGLGAAVFAFFFYLIFNWRAKRKLIATIFISLLVLLSVLITFRNTSLVKKLPGGRLFEIVDLGYKTQTVQTRLWTWGSAWKGFKERPILGWGPENFSTVFDKYFDSRHFIPNQNTETWFDRAHSVIFDYLAETGILGFLSFIAIFVFFYIQFFKTRKVVDREDDKKVEVLQALVFALPIGYLVQGLALFDVLPIYINLFLFMAFANYRFTRQ
jgi:O-antigen ligase